MQIKTIHKLKMPYQYKIKGLNWVLNRIVKYTENKLLRKASIKGCIQNTYREYPIILSMTTFPERIPKAIMTVKSLLNQNIAVDKFIIWLAREQFLNEEIPEDLLYFTKYGVEICFCDDLRSHKKYYYTMKTYPKAVVITVDDDVIYPEDTIKKLLNIHQKYPNTVVCNMGRKIAVNEKGFLPYQKWKVNIPRNIKQPTYQILPIGEGGILYPPNSLDLEVFDKEKIIFNAFSADDLWLKFMEVKNGTKVVITEKIQRGLCEVNSKTEEQALNIENVKGGKNDIVINNLNRLYPEVYDIIFKANRGK